MIWRRRVGYLCKEMTQVTFTLSERIGNMLSKETSKTRRFRIWAICLLLFVVVSVCIIAHLSSRPSEPFVSVSFVRTNTSWTSIELSNRTSVDMRCWTGIPLAKTGVTNQQIAIVPFGTGSFLLPAHSRQSELVVMRTSVFVGYERERTRLEISIFNKLPPWLKRYYPFQPRLFSSVYEVPNTENFPNWTGIVDE
jgi:hypothetical protein